MTDTFLDNLIETTEVDNTTDETTGEWPKVVDMPKGERPEGSLTVSEFAEKVNADIIRNKVQELLAADVPLVDAAVQAAAEQVAAGSFYQAIKAQRNPMPHYVVRSEFDVEDVDAEGNVTGTHPEVDEKTYIPEAEGLAWWQNRPTRGSGGSGAKGSEEDIAKRLVRAGKKVQALKAAQARLAKVQELVNKFQGQVDKYEELLKGSNHTLADAEKAAEESDEANEEANAIEG
jgi:hypothetical protein